MKIVHIKQKLAEIDVSIDSIAMGDFDKLGELTAKRERSKEDLNYKKFGAYYRSNYERGILIYYLIRKFNLTSMLEVGFGRGYSALCAAKALYDSGTDGKILTIDPALNEQLRLIQSIFPELFKYIQFIKGFSRDTLPTITDKFNLVYIDGDHSYLGTKNDWEMSKNKFTHFCLFDDYHLPTKQDLGIQCNRAIDEIDWQLEDCLEPELIRLDRRLFCDDRGLSDEDVDYGQVLFTKKSVNDEEW